MLILHLFQNLELSNFMLQKTIDPCFTKYRYFILSICICNTNIQNDERETSIILIGNNLG